MLKISVKFYADHILSYSLTCNIICGQTIPLPPDPHPTNRVTTVNHLSIFVCGDEVAYIKL